MPDKGGEYWWEIEPGCYHIDAHPLALNRKDASILVQIPENPSFLLERNRWGEPWSDRPVHMSSYWIGVYYITNAQYQKFVRETKYRPPNKATRGMPVWHGGDFPPEKAECPVVCVSWEDAKAYAAWAGGHLPSVLQWKRAMQGFLSRGYQPKAMLPVHEGGVSAFGIHAQSNFQEWCLLNDSNGRVYAPHDWDSDLHQPLCCYRDGHTSFQEADGLTHVNTNPQTLDHQVSFRLVKNPT